MSMLGISLLNEIIRKKEATNAAQVLDQLRELLIDALHKQGAEREQKDGMDIALCVLNKTTHTLQYAGANNPLYIVKSNGDLQIIMADKQSISISDNPKPFTNHQIQLSKGDCVYLATDGYKDQFGGPKGKKFMGKQFANLLQALAPTAIDQQREALLNTFENWRGLHEQVDDVTVFGIKV